MSCGDTGRFPAEMRLKRRRDFRNVYANGYVWTGSCFSAHVCSNDIGPRLGITIPKRWGTAVERNRMKRRIREAFRRCMGALPSVDLLVKPKPECAKQDGETIARQLIAAAHRTARVKGEQ